MSISNERGINYAPNKYGEGGSGPEKLERDAQVQRVVELFKKIENIKLEKGWEEVAESMYVLDDGVTVDWKRGVSRDRAKEIHVLLENNNSEFLAKVASASNVTLSKDKVKNFSVVCALGIQAVEKIKEEEEKDAKRTQQTTRPQVTPPSPQQSKRSTENSSTWEEELSIYREIRDPKARQKALSGILKDHSSKMSRDDRTRLVEEINSAYEEKEQSKSKKESGEKKKDENGRAINEEQATIEFDKIQNANFLDKSVRQDLLRNWNKRFGTVVTNQELREKAAKLYKEVHTPEGIKEPPEGWLAWGRNQLAEYLDPTKEKLLSETQRQGPFQQEIETLFGGKTYVDGLPYFPEGVKEKLEDEKRMVFEISRLYFRWCEIHKSFGSMTSAIDNKSNDLPTNVQLAKILNDLCGDEGRRVIVNGKEKIVFEENVGSKNVANAIKLYYDMAIGGNKAGSGNEFVIGLDNNHKTRVQSIFNTNLQPDEVNEMRKRVGKLCGGAYYESLGLVIAKFMGFAARGYDNSIPAIGNSDIMGRLIWSGRINNTHSSIFSVDYQWLPKEIANYFCEQEKKNGEPPRYKKVNDKNIPIEAAVDLTTLKRKGAYIIENLRARNGLPDYRLTKVELALANRLINDPESNHDLAERFIKLKSSWRWDKELSSAINEQRESRKKMGQPFSENDINLEILKKISSEKDLPDMRDIIEKGDLDKIDWKKSNYGILELQKFYESNSINLLNLFSNVKTDKEQDVSLDGLIKTRTNIILSLAHENGTTKDHVGYLYLFSLLHRHSLDYLTATKGVDAGKNAWQNKRMKDIVRLAEAAKLISSDGSRALYKHFNLGFF